MSVHPAMNPILSICYLLAAWLSLHGGTSRETSNAMLRALNFIVSATVTIFMAFIRSLGHDVPTPTLQLVRDIRTVYKVCEVEPTIIRTPCCPTCFSTFPPMRFLLFVLGGKTRKGEKDAGRHYCGADRPGGVLNRFQRLTSAHSHLTRGYATFSCVLI